MFKNNPNVLSDGEVYTYSSEDIQEFIKCKEDIIYFAEKYVYITTIDNGWIIIKLRDYQKKILKQLVCPQDKRLHNILLCPRQSAKTTTVAIYILHYILFNAEKTIAILANKEDTAFEILNKIQRAYLDLPKFLQQGIREWNKGSITLGNNTNVAAKATSKGSISGHAISLLYIDEFAKIPDHVIDEFVSSTMPVISQGKTAKIIISSTPLGQNAFYDFWSRAIREESDFFPIKVNWWEVYSQEFKDSIIRNYGEAHWLQEYSLRFIGSTNTLIDPDILENMRYYDPIYLKWNGLFKIWEKPIKNARYILGVDSGKGLGKNFSVIQVLRIYKPLKVIKREDNGKESIEYIENVEQVAIYRYNKIDPHEFSKVCIEIANYYNKAYMMIENNNDCGGIVSNTIWYEFNYENVCNFESKELGIRSTKKSKLIANLLLKKFIESKWLKINDKDTIKELGKYVEVSLNVFKGETRDTLDDCVTALLWAVYYMRTTYYDEFQGELDDDIKQEVHWEEDEDYNKKKYTDDIDTTYPLFYIT